MPWQQLQFSASSRDTEELEQFLLDAGCQSVTLVDAKDQPVYQLEPGATPLWDSVVVHGLFEFGLDLSALIKTLETFLANQPDPEFTIEILQDQDWEKAWMADFQPMQFGKRLWVCPHWQSPPDPDAINIMLDPGLAFGTGTHATTALCLEWLEQTELEGSLLIDYGCGSGILSIAAVLLGASKVIAVDNDPQAIIASQANRDSNHIDERFLACYLPDEIPLRYLPRQADVLVANILAGPLQQLAEKFSSLVAVDGFLVLSGILPEQAESLLTCYGAWFTMEKPIVRDGWVRLCGIRR